MRIVYVSADRGIEVFGEKGAAVHVQAMLRAFVAQDHQVRCLTARLGTEHDIGVSFEELAPVSGGIDRRSKELAAIKQGDVLEQRLLELHQQWPYELIYERYSLWSAAGSRAGQVLGVPTIVEINSPLIAEQKEHRSLECEDEAIQIERDILTQSTALAAVSEQVARYLHERGADASIVHVIRNAVDTETFRPQAVPANIDSVPANAFVVGFTGSLKRWHGVDILLDAFRKFHREVPEAHLLICGDGPKRGWIDGYIAGANLDDAVSCIGWVDHSVLPSIIALMDVATAPYPLSSDHYFSPLKVYEYLAVGRPILASDIGQVSDVLSSSESAMLVPPGNSDALADAFVELYKNPARRASMAQAAAELGAKNDWRDNADRVTQIIQGNNSPQ